MRYRAFRMAALTAGVLIMMLGCSRDLLCQGNAGRPYEGGTFSVRGGVGTDINLGLGFGAGAAYVWNAFGGGTTFELGADVYYHHLTDSYTDQRGSVTVKGEDKTTLIVFGVRANALFNYGPSRRRVYFIAGFGFVVASLRWEETENAPNWTAPYRDEVKGTTAGSIVNIGIGIPLLTNLDIRVETPLLILYSSAGKSAAFVPTATIGMTFRFN
jgi:hypothetical protein